MAVSSLAEYFGHISRHSSLKIILCKDGTDVRFVTARRSEDAVAWWSNRIGRSHTIPELVRLLYAFYALLFLPPTKEEVHVFACVCLSLCLLARLLKNACMDLYEMLRVYRCRRKVICVPVALPASTSANTPAEGNQRFHLRTEFLWIPVTKPGRTPPIMPTWAFNFYAYEKKKTDVGTWTNWLTLSLIRIIVRMPELNCFLWYRTSYKRCCAEFYVGKIPARRYSEPWFQNGFIHWAVGRPLS